MAGKGGYQQPAHPAPVSGPGALSQRTDGGAGNQRQPIRDLPDAQYGDNEAFVQQQQAAPVPQTQSPQPPRPSLTPQQARAAALAPPATSFHGPSVMPNLPVTDGAATGPGRGPDALFQNSNAGTVQATLQGLAASDQSGAVQQLLAAARAQGA